MLSPRGDLNYRFACLPVMPQTSWSIGSGSAMARFTQVRPWMKTGTSVVSAPASWAGTAGESVFRLLVPEFARA
jgi:hypothetical protein